MIAVSPEVLVGSPKREIASNTQDDSKRTVSNISCNLCARRCSAGIPNLKAVPFFIHRFESWRPFNLLAKAKRPEKWILIVAAQTTCNQWGRKTRREHFPFSKSIDQELGWMQLAHTIEQTLVLDWQWHTAELGI